MCNQPTRGQTSQSPVGHLSYVRRQIIQRGVQQLQLIAGFGHRSIIALEPIAGHASVHKVGRFVRAAMGDGLVMVYLKLAARLGLRDAAIAAFETKLRTDLLSQ